MKGFVEFRGKINKIILIIIIKGLKISLIAKIFKEN